MSRLRKQWQNRVDVLKNEEGAVIVAAIMILVFLTIIGIASIRVSNTEVQISGNELRYQQHLYRAEGATMEAVQQLELDSDPTEGNLVWLETQLDSVTENEIKAWQFGGSPNPVTSVLDNPGLADVSYMAASEGVVSGSSLDMTSSKVHGYTIYGRSSLPNKGTIVVEIGYLKAF